MRENIIEVLKNIFSRYYYCTFSWRQSNAETGLSFRLYRIPFWNSLTIQVQESIQELESAGKGNVYLESAKGL